MTTTRQFVAMAEAEHGININTFIQQVLDGRTLAEKVRDQLIAARPGREQDHCWDEDIRWAYAKAVASRMGLRRYGKRLFAELRTNKCWGWCEREVMERFIRVFGNLMENGPCWGIDFQSFVHLYKAGCTPIQAEEILRLLVHKYHQERANMATVRSGRYSQGTHTGEMVDIACRTIKRGHIFRYVTFKRAMRITLDISPSPVPARYLRVLEKMDKGTLTRVLTDRRNWKECTRYSFLVFRLVEVPSVQAWEPLTYPRQTEAAWMRGFNRVPQKWNIRSLPVKLIESFTKKTFSLFIKELKALRLEEPHSVLSLARLCAWFGKDWRSVLDKVELSESDMNLRIHGLGIILPNKVIQPEGVTFFKRYLHRPHDAARVLKFWETVKTLGVNPLEKSGLEAALKAVATLNFEGVKDLEFALEAGKWINDQRKFEEYQERWLRINPPYESIPMVDVVDGRWRCHRLLREDPRGLFLGEYTGCCQHPGGVGDSCAWAGAENKDCAFLILEKDGEIKWQSWLWRYGTTLVADNVEGFVSGKNYQFCRKMYINTLQQFVGKLGISRVLIGTSLSKLQLPHDSSFHLEVSAPATYSDAVVVWDVTNYKEGA